MKRPVLLAVALLVMGLTAIAGWQMAATPPNRAADPVPRVRLAILPFDDPASELDDAFNRALAEAFSVALASADPANFAVIGPATTARMMAAGLSPAEIASRADADLLLSGGHSETDHSTVVRLGLADGEEVLSRGFEIDEAAPATAPVEVVEAIAEAIRSLREERRRTGAS